MDTTKAFAIALLLLLGSTPLIDASHGSSSPAGSVVVRVTLSNVMPGENSEDWVFDGNLSAAESLPACRAAASSMHNRFYNQRFIDFTLWFNGTSETNDCIGAGYTVTLYAYSHGLDNLYDINGTEGGPGTRCPKEPGPSEADAYYCRAVIPFTLTGDPVNGTLDGSDDDNDLFLEDDMSLSYRIEVASSSLGISEINVPSPEWVPWMVRVDILNFTIVGEPNVTSSEDANLTDWFFEGTIANATDDCAATARTTHSRFLAPSYVEFIIRNGTDCQDEPMALKLVAYEHAPDSYLDLNGASGIGEFCPPTPAGTQGNLPHCQLVLNFNLNNGTVSGSADGSDDGLPGDKDVQLDYRVTILRDPETATGHMRFRIIHKNNTLLYDDWLVDGEATGSGGCKAQGRTFHSRFVRPASFDFTFRNATACLDNPVNISLVVYLHADDGLVDINGTREADGGEPCRNSPTPPPGFVPGCRLVFPWSTPSIFLGRNESGADDDFNDHNDAAINLTLKRFPDCPCIL